MNASTFHIPGCYVLAPLQGLSQAEEMLISDVMPIMSIYCLPEGQYGYSGHIVNLPQDVASFARTLPRLPFKLDVIVVRNVEKKLSHHDFHVRRDVVLQWLISNNTYYHANQVRIDQEALTQLPQDGNLSHLVSVALDSPSASDQQIPVTDEAAPYDAHLVR